MIKIKKINFLDKKQLQYLEEYISLISFPKVNKSPSSLCDLVHSIVPLGWKFLPEIYAAVDGRTILGLVSLAPINSQKTRWRVNSLLLSKNTEGIAKQLVDFVTSKYGALGVGTFLSTVEENNAEIISIFKEGCGFRSCARIKIFRHANLHLLNFDNNGLEFREFNSKDIEKILDINTSNLIVQFKPSLYKNSKDFAQTYLDLGKHDKFKVVCLNNRIIGYFKLTNPANNQYWLDLIVSEAFVDYYSDILGYVKENICFDSTNPELYVYLKQYRQTSSKLLEILENNAFEQICSAQVLVKDYWKPIKVNGEEKSFMLFNDRTSPACIVSHNYRD